MSEKERGMSDIREALVALIRNAGEAGDEIVFECDCEGCVKISGGLADAILAECEAKRRIVELHSGTAEWCGWTQGGDGTHADMGDDCDTLIALAQPYADHPDYDPAWGLTRD